MTMLGHLLAAVTPTVTTNPNSGDAWLGRIETVLLILGGAATVLRITAGRFHASVADIVKVQVKKEAKRIRKELRVHTDAEAGLVHDEIKSALVPVIASVDRLSGRFDGLNAERDIAARRNDQDHAEFRDAIAQLAQRKSSA